MPWAVDEAGIGHFQSRLHHGLAGVCSDHHVLLSLQCLSAVGRDRRQKLHNAVRSLLARRPQVVLYCPLELPHDQMPLNTEVLDLLVEGGAEVILIDREVVTYLDRSAYPWISYDNRRGSARLVTHMAEQGYRRIAFVGIADDSTAVFDRRAGYHDGLRLCGLEADPRLALAVEACPDESAWDDLLSRKPDAVVCKDSVLAAQLGTSLARRGMKLGPDIGLAGFDEDPIASLLPVPLTIVRQPIAPFAQAIYQTALTLTSGGEPDLPPLPRGAHMVIPTELVIKASTRRSS